MHIFDYSFLARQSIEPTVLNQAMAITAISTMSSVREQKYEKVFTELERVAVVESVRSSNAIEGIVTTDSRIMDIVARKLPPNNHNEAEIAGYRDALSLVHQHHDSLALCSSDILLLHKTMFAFTEDPEAGKFKTDNNLILEMDRDGNRQIRFRPVSAMNTPKAMEQLELSWISAKSDNNINPLLLIPCVILDFLCIHPFKDGNGRMARLLTLLLLYKYGYDACKYISLEAQINMFKADYYASLRESSSGWHENSNDYLPFIKHSLYMLYRCYKELDNRFAVFNSGHVSKNARIESTVLNSLIPISKAEICQLLPDVSVSTVESVLGAMVKGGQIIRIGAGRSTRYIKAK
jgi:Fic family protein